MKIGKFEVKKQENTKWDYIVPWGLAIIEAVTLTIVFSYGYSEEMTVGGMPTMSIAVPSANDWFLYSMEIILIFLLISFATFYLKGEYRFIVFPLAIFVSSYFMQNFKIVHPAILVGFGYALGSLIIYTREAHEIKNAWKKIGIYWGIVGFGYGLIYIRPMIIIKALGLGASAIHDVSLISLIPMLFPLITLLIVVANLTVSYPAANVINALIWAIVFPLFGIVLTKLLEKRRKNIVND